MNAYHVVPRGDAIQHVTIGGSCPCGVEVRTYPSDDRPGTDDTWYYHRLVPISEAVFAPLTAGEVA